VTDRVAQNELSVERCPTGDLIADFMTKPPQGALFKKITDLIMGVTCTTSKTYKDSLTTDSPTKSLELPPTRLKMSQACRNHNSVLEGVYN